MEAIYKNGIIQTGKQIKMETENITESMQVHKQWYEDAKKQTLKTLPDFINKLLSYGHDYGTICHAFTAASIATLWAMNKEPQGGITGFQGGAIMWEFIRNWNYESNKTGLKIIDYDNMLYPQYEDNFQNIINKSTWENLQKEAKQLLKEDKGFADKSVINHWKSIANGFPPFGTQISDD